MATLDDVAVGLGRPIDSQDEQAQVQQWLDDALLLIRLRLGDPDLLDQDALDFVVREAVLARMRNPEGFTSETIDDYTYRLPENTRRVTILPEWWDMLAPGDGGAGIYSVRPGFDADTTQWSVRQPLLDSEGWPVA